MALSAARSTTRKLAQPVTGYDLPVKTSVTIYQGAIVVCNAGYAAPGTAAASLIAMGVAAETVANTGADGAVKCRVERGAFWMKNSGSDAVVAADLGGTCYIEDDQTVCHTSTSKSAAGQVLEIDTTLGVLVEIGY